MAINQLNNGDSGLTARTIINSVVAATNTLATSGTASYALTAANLNPTSKVIADIFMHPQTITSNINIPQEHNAFLVGPVSITGTIEVGTNSNLTIIP